MYDAGKIQEEYTGCMFCDLKENSKQKLLSFLNDLEGYMYSLFTESVYDATNEVYKDYDISASMLIVFFFFFGFVIVMNTTLTNIQDVKKELCILRTLGFQNSEISRSRFVRLLIQLICSSIIGNGKIFAWSAQY